MPLSIPSPTPATFTHLIHSFAADEVLTEEHLREVCDDLKVDLLLAKTAFGVWLSHS